jgi:hypothetical protein
MRGFQRGAYPFLFAHVKQQPIVNIIDAEHCNHYCGIYNQIFITFNIFKQEDKRHNRYNHHQKIKYGNTIK